MDARSLLEALVRGAGPSPGAAAQGQGELADVLGNLMQGGATSRPGSATGIEGALRNLTQGGDAGGGMADIVAKLQALAGQGTGGLADVLGQVLGQATQGVREGAQRVDQVTGASDRVREAVGQASGGQTPEELMAKLKDLVGKRQLETGAALSGLGALVLGTETGRSLATSAAKLGALALIGGLAYKAYQNYQQGKPLITGASGLMAGPAPAGSGFEPQAISNDTAVLCIRAMVGAAAADGRIDRAEQQKIVGGLERAGLDEAASRFLQREIESPASVADLAAAVQSKQQALQVFTAARLAVDLDTEDEHNFLVALADRLDISPELAAYIDAATTSAAVPSSSGSRRPTP